MSTLPKSPILSHEEKQLRSASDSESDPEAYPPPAYSEAVAPAVASGSSSTAGFAATTQLQIHAAGLGQTYELTMPRPDPIPVYRLQPDSTGYSYEGQEPAYTSLRLKQSSNSCGLVRGSEPTATPLIATLYRWGPGRRPRIRILPSHSTLSVEQAINENDIECDLVEVSSRSVFSRTQRMTAPFGTFQWRYGSRGEREVLQANSLLVLERFDQTTSGKGSKNGEWNRVAQFIRNDEFRTPGTHKRVAGNGGRLMIDSRALAGEKDGNMEQVEAFVVASCILMMKREVDRERDNQISVVV